MKETKKTFSNAVPRLVAVALLAVLVASGRGAAEPSEPVRRPWIFTQVHRDALPWWQGRWRPQRVPDGAQVEVQLPGGPTVWTWKEPCEPTPYVCDGCPTLPRAKVELRERTLLPNPDRIAGTAAIYQFDAVVRGPGLAALCLEGDPPSPPASSEGALLGPPAHYVLTLEVEGGSTP